MKLTKKQMIVLVALLCALGIAFLAIAYVNGKSVAVERDGNILHKAIVDENGRIALVGQHVMEISSLPIENESGETANSASIPIIARVGQYISMANDYESPHTITMGNQLKSGGVANTSMSNVWDLGDRKRLVFLDYDSSAFEARYALIDELADELVSPFDGLEAIPPEIARTLRKVKGGFLLGGYAYLDGHEISMCATDEISLYDNDLNMEWAISSEAFFGGLYKDVIETSESFILYGSAANDEGEFFPSALALDKGGNLLWRRDEPDALGCRFSGGTYRANGDIVLVMSNTDLLAHDKTSKLYVMNEKGEEIYLKDLMDDHFAFNPTSVVEIDNQLLISANQRSNNRAVIVILASYEGDCVLMDVTQNRKCIRQTTYLVKESDEVAHAYGYCEYNDRSAREDASQGFHSFIQPITTESSAK